jgi:hypothetical protein
MQPGGGSRSSRQRSFLLLIPSVQIERPKQISREDRILSSLAIRIRTKSKAGLLFLSENFQFPGIGDIRGTVIEKQVAEIRYARSCLL